jgi:hypothetical protein
MEVSNLLQVSASCGNGGGRGGTSLGSYLVIWIDITLLLNLNVLLLRWMVTSSHQGRLEFSPSVVRMVLERRSGTEARCSLSTLVFTCSLSMIMIMMITYHFTNALYSLICREGWCNRSISGCSFIGQSHRIPTSSWLVSAVVFSCSAHIWVLVMFRSQVGSWLESVKMDTTHYLFLKLS